MEEALGIEVFLTDIPGIGGKLKGEPEDFVVDEIPIDMKTSEDGRYVVARIRTRNWETNRLIRMLARTLGISRKRIRFAGTKDKRAITTQYIQFDCPPELVSSLRLRDVEVQETYRTEKRMELGDLLGNRFDIRITAITIPTVEVTRQAVEIADCIKSLGGFPNFFGVQRFGATRPITHIIGKKICEGDFEGAVFSYLTSPSKTESEEAQEARRTLLSTRDFDEALKMFPKRLSFERAILNRLVKTPDDYPGAIEALPLNLQMMFVHAHQSYLFNMVLGERIRRGLPLNEPVDGDVIIPAKENGLPDRKKVIEVSPENIEKASRRVREGKAFVSGMILGTESVFAKGPVGEIETSIAARENATPDDFLIPRIPRISSKGSRREILAPLKDFRFSVEPGSVKFAFQLIPGSYATSLLREFMKADLMNY